MVRIHWQGQNLSVRRIVLSRATSEGGLGKALHRAAARGDIAIVVAVATPKEGDFWIGCLPEKGWPDIDSEEIGWALGLEAPLALAALRGSVTEQAEAPLVVRPPDALLVS